MPNQIQDGVDGDNGDLMRARRPNGASGHAALLLVESLIHHLISNKTLTVPEAIEIIEVAAEVEHEVALTANDGLPPLTVPSSLTALANSLRIELED